MPLHWSLSHPQRLVIAIARGEVQPQEVEKYLADMFAQGGGPYRKMFDVSQTQTEFDDSALKGFAETVRRHAAAGPIGPIAIVATSEESFRQAAVFAEAATVDRPPIRCSSSAKALSQRSSTRSAPSAPDFRRSASNI